MKKLILFSATVWLGISAAGAQPKISLEDYLGQVKSQGPDFKASQAAVEGYEKQSHQQDLTYSPQLVASYNHLDDTEKPSNPLLNPHNLTDTAGVSITNKLPFGPSISVGYAFSNSNITLPSFYSSPQAQAFFGNNVPLAAYYQIAPVVSLSVPLFKDFGGSQTAAGVHKVQFQLESAKQNSVFQREQVLYNAKVAYWNLVLTREQMVIRKDTLDRSQKIWDWTRRRVARNLADPPDALQAEASVRVAELDLQMATESERSARLAFNRFRNAGNENVSEELDTLEESLARVKVEIPGTLPSRLDLKAVERTAQSQKASYDEANQNIFPDITASASWRGNGYDANFDPANQAAFNYTYPTWNIGAQLNLPLDVFTASRVAEGYKSNYESARLSFEDKKIQVGQEWQDLQNHISDVEKRLAMSAQIVEIQKNKADQEKTRLELGRTTQFQLLSFENDYALARLNRLSLVLEKLSLLAQAQWWLSAE